MTNQQQPVVVRVEAPPSNGLGIAGFVVSLVGIVTCGILCPLGALLSFIALFKRPRGFAFAGFIIGMLGTLFVAAVLLLYGVAVMAVFKAGGFKSVITTANMDVAADRIKQWRTAHWTYPDDVDGQPLVTVAKDGWGHVMQYHLTRAGSDFEIRSAGPDGVFGTTDDLTYTSAGPVSTGPSSLPAAP